MKQVATWQDLLTDNVAEARQVLDVMLTDRIRFTPLPKHHGYEVRLSVGYDRMFTKMLPALGALQVMPGSPRAPLYKMAFGIRDWGFGVPLQS
jgi:hypothetical protein